MNGVPDLINHGSEVLELISENMLLLPMFQASKLYFKLLAQPLVQSNKHFFGCWQLVLVTLYNFAPQAAVLPIILCESLLLNFVFDNGTLSLFNRLGHVVQSRLDLLNLIFR